YSNLLAQMIGRRVGKTASYTRWDARPLTAEQLNYAAEDVAHLLELADDLQRRLKADGRLEWAREECRRLEEATDERDPETVWERLPRVGQLDPQARAVARELAAWRERTAAHEDRPVGSVRSDSTLEEAAKPQPTSLKALEQTRGMHPPGIRRQPFARSRAGGPNSWGVTCATFWPDESPWPWARRGDWSSAGSRLEDDGHCRRPVKHRPSERQGEGARSPLDPIQVDGQQL